jgi:hypothetical protein
MWVLPQSLTTCDRVKPLDHEPSEEPDPGEDLSEKPEEKLIDGL